MSHYTVGTGSSPELHDLAVSANRARSQAYRDAFTAIRRLFAKKRSAHHALPGAAHQGGV